MEVGRRGLPLKLHENVEKARREISRVVQGYEEPITLLFVALGSRGHVLVEGVPGVGKTTLCKAFSQVTGLEFRRIQLTPDLMPTDVTGHTYFDQRKNTFEVRPGPVFTNVLLADEINRAPPRTQAALLEVMEERQVTVDGRTLPVPSPFLVLATKNPVDVEGVFPLPEAQLDRFLLVVRLPYPDLETERKILENKVRSEGPIEPVAGLVENLEEAKESVRVHKDIAEYILRIVRSTRESPDLLLGASPRASVHLQDASRVFAALEGRSFVVPDDVKTLTIPVLSHRLILTPEAEIAGKTKGEILTEILNTVEPPVEVPYGADRPR